MEGRQPTVDSFGNNYGLDFARQQQLQQQIDAMARQATVGPGLPQTPKNGNVPSGSLIIADTYSPSWGETRAHGQDVNAAARRDGFRGPVFTMAQPRSARAALMEAQEVKFFDTKATPRELRDNVAAFASTKATDFLQKQTSMVRGATNSGAKNTALNLSMGRSVSSTTNEVYQMAAGAWNTHTPADQRGPYKQVAGNLARAYNLDMAKLTSTDPKVAGPERAKLQAGLAKDVSGSLAKDPGVAKAKREFNTEVGRFESGRNSVVVAAGNWGDVRDEFRKDAKGSKAKLPENFDTNLIETAATTSVGATRWSRGAQGPRESVAGYTSRSNGSDIYASGSLDMVKDGKGADTFGTSFAAPRVAATMATLHKQNPQMSSAQIEHLMKSKLTHQLETPAGAVPVLDFQKSSDLMVGRASQ